MNVLMISVASFMFASGPKVAGQLAKHQPRFHEGRARQHRPAIELFFAQVSSWKCTLVNAVAIWDSTVTLAIGGRTTMACASFGIFHFRVGARILTQRLPATSTVLWALYL